MPATRSVADTYVSIAELMRLARGSYKRAIDAEYAVRGIDDVPAPGGYVLAYLANGEESIPEMIEGLGIKKPEYAEFMDRLVLRGFITRDIDPNDGKASFALTERGYAAAEAIFAGGRIVDKQLECKVSADDIDGLRRGLLALAEIKQSLPQP
jgi:DNA-binding MarR family transcriptional regulator